MSLTRNRLMYNKTEKRPSWKMKGVWITNHKNGSAPIKEKKKHNLLP